MRFSPISTFTLVVSSLALAACSATDSTRASGSQPMTVSFSTAATTGASAASIPSAATASSPADVLLITKAQLVVARIELQRAGATCTGTTAAGDDDVDDRDCAELELAPTLVDLPTNGTLANALSVSVPAGTYSALEAKIRPVRADGDRGRGSSAFLAAHPDLSGVSVLVSGTFNGKAFTYAGSPRAELETVFNPPMTVDATPANLTVHVDLSSWFTVGGVLVDPATANVNGANANAVADNIRRSFRAFRDDDHDGRDDDRGR